MANRLSYILEALAIVLPRLCPVIPLWLAWIIYTCAFIAFIHTIGNNRRDWLWPRKFFEWWKSKWTRKQPIILENGIVRESSFQRKVMLGERHHGTTKEPRHEVLYRIHYLKNKIPFWDGGDETWVNLKKEFGDFNNDELAALIEDMEGEGLIKTNVISGSRAMTPMTLVRITTKGEDKLKGYNQGIHI